MRCPDSAAGKKARCPACGTIVTIAEGGGGAVDAPSEPTVPVPPILSGGPPTPPTAAPGGPSPFAGPQTPSQASGPELPKFPPAGQPAGNAAPAGYSTQPANPYAAPQTTPAAPTRSERMGSEGWAIASFVLGLLGLLAWLCPIFGYVIGGCALGFGIMGRDSNQNVLAIIGIVLGSITLLLSLANSILGVILMMQGGQF
ncbi:MAG: hypothetical protein D6741_03040 [Planctomycetota bacterium]|nr:MAG: hypothetical protein D6741_03040 [Planctomycetota bacterium]